MEFLEIAVAVAGLVFVVFVGLAAVVFVVGLVVDAFHTRNGNDHEPPTLDVQNHIGDPNDPTAGAH